MVRVYTGGGDRGETSLADGQRVRKSDPRVDLYGQLDELNSFVGLGIAKVNNAIPGRSGVPERQLLDFVAELTALQHELFALCGLLADPARCERTVQPGAPQHVARTGKADQATEASEDEFLLASTRLEKQIDRLSEDLDPLSAFILPGGHESAACLHLARTVCRRVERAAVAASPTTVIPDAAIVFLNRLSDYFFVAARWVNKTLGVMDVLLEPRAARDERKSDPK